MDPQYRDLAAESVYEYGSRAGVWRVQRLIDSFEIPITMFGCAISCERNARGRRSGCARPATSRARTAGAGRSRGCSPATRSASTSHEAIASIERTCGERPRGWYCRYGPSVHTRELLVEEGGFVYDSDVYNDDLPVLRRGLRQAPPGRALQLHLQRRQVRAPAGLLGPVQLPRPAAAAASTTCGRRARRTRG